MQAFLLPSAVDKCLDMIVGKIENGLERGFVKHRLNCLLKTDPEGLSERFVGRNKNTACASGCHILNFV